MTTEGVWDRWAGMRKWYQEQESVCCSGCNMRVTENSVSPWLQLQNHSVQMSVSRHPPTHPPTRPPFYTYNQTSGSYNSRGNSTSWSSLPLVSGISAFATPPTLLLLQLTHLPGPRSSILTHLSPLATTCFQVDTCLQHQHTVSQGADRLLQMCSDQQL